MQKAIVVRYDLPAGLKDHLDSQEKAVSELNDHLKNGWIVKHAFPMSGHSYNLASISLVIIEKDESGS